MKKIRQILEVLEKQVDKKPIVEDLQLPDDLERLAKMHLKREKEIEDLVNRLDELETEDDEIKAKILDLMGTTKSQVLKFGKIIIDFRLIRRRVRNNPRPQYQKIVQAILETYRIEGRWFERIKQQFTRQVTTRTETDKVLDIRKESYQLQESFSLKSFAKSFIDIFKNLIKPFAQKVDNLQDMMDEMR